MRGIFAALIIVLITLPASAQERFLSFHTAIEVEPDGDVLITETFEYDLQLHKKKRGILRDFPTRYVDDRGNDHVVGFELISATRNGKPETAKVERISNGVRIRLGQADFFLPSGIHTYRLRYRTDRQLIFHEDKDELYFNVIGHGWAFTIRQATASIYLPAGADILESRVWTGYQGGKAQNAVIEKSRANEVNLRTTKPLLPHQGMTASITWQKGIVQEPGATAELNWFIRDNFFAIMSAIGIFVMFAYYIFAWAWIGRDPRKGTIIARFEPPKGLSAAACQYIMDRGANNSGFAAAIIALAVKGFCTMSDGERKGAYTLEKTGQVPDLFPGERALSKYLFVGQGRTHIGGKFSQRVKTARDAFETVLDQEYGSENFRKNRIWSFFGVGFSAIIVISVVMLSGQVEKFFPFLAIGLFVSVFLGFTGATVLNKLRRSSASRPLKKIITFLPLGVGVFFMANMAQGFVDTVDLNSNTIMGGVMILSAVLLALIFSYLLEAPTLSGRALMDEIAGFKLYLEVAEEKLLEFQHPPEKTPELFERFLPFAIALGVENQWGDKFSDILSATTVEGQPVYRHHWYSGRNFSHSQVGQFSSTLSSGLATAAASASTAPSKSSGGSSSSGGGSSGGGGGGGGGSSW